MSRKRLAAAGAGLLLWAAAVLVWAVLGTAGLLLLLAAFIVGVLVLTAALLSRVRKALRLLSSTSRAVTATTRELEGIGRSLDRLAEQPETPGQVSEELTEEITEAVKPVVDGLYPQIEGLLSLHSTLKPQRPLPPLREWAVSPDFMARAITIVLDRRPTTIVECGSGSSTVYLGLALRQNGGGRVVALEHKERFAVATRALLAEHGLADVATVHHAPLRPVTIGGREWLWYDAAALDDVERCELLIVDGPPRTVQDLARYPALPLLRDRLVPGALVLMDDYRRDSERRTVRRWRKENPGLTIRVHEHEKETAELEWPGPE